MKEEHPLAAEFGRRVAARAKSAVRRKAGDALHRVGDWAQRIVNGVHEKADEVASPTPAAAPTEVVIVAPPVAVPPVGTAKPRTAEVERVQLEAPVVADQADGGSPLRSI